MIEAADETFDALQNSSIVIDVSGLCVCGCSLEEYHCWKFSFVIDDNISWRE